MSKQKDNLEIIELTEQSIESMVYFIRGQKVMLDLDLARIYGYETKDFNRQVKNNIGKFPDDFMFQLSKAEATEVLRCKNSTLKSKDNYTPRESMQSSWCKNSTLNNDNDIFEEEKTLNESEKVLWSKKSTLNKSGNSRGFNIKYLPYAFTEQGIYMLMTVLKGELATNQSKALIRLFKKMKDYIVESNNLINANEIIKLTSKVYSNSFRLTEVEKKLDVVMDNFIDPSTYKHFLFLDGERLEADIAYQKLYSLANKSLIIVDDYLSIKTLELLKAVNNGVYIYLFSDNKSKNKLTGSFVKDFMNETGNIVVTKPTNGRFHDRYIVIDYATDNEHIYHCGSSSKDTGNKISTIKEIEDSFAYKKIFEDILNS